MPGSLEERSALGQQERREDALDLHQCLNHLQLEGDDAVPVFPLLSLFGTFRQLDLEHLGEERQPVLERFLGKALDLLGVVILHHVHEIETTTEDVYSEGAKGRLPAVVDGDVKDVVDDRSGHGEELVLGQALLDDVAQDLEGAVEADVVAIGYDVEEGREEGRPFLGEVIVRNLPNGITAKCY